MMVFGTELVVQLLNIPSHPMYVLSSETILYTKTQIVSLLPFNGLLQCLVDNLGSDSFSSYRSSKYKQSLSQVCIYNFSLICISNTVGLIYS